MLFRRLHAGCIERERYVAAHQSRVNPITGNRRYSTM
jgi:hypothetical protein